MNKHGLNSLMSQFARRLDIAGAEHRIVMGIETVARVPAMEQYVPKDVAEARANLFAAAPELLEALKGVIAWAEAYEATGPRAKDQEERCAFARAAIAKAEGK